MLTVLPALLMLTPPCVPHRYLPFGLIPGSGPCSGSIPYILYLTSPMPIPTRPPLQLHLPGMSTSASFDDLLHQLMMAESTLSTSL